jgi:hypothetical protein
MSDSATTNSGSAPEFTQAQQIDALSEVFGPEYAAKFQDPVIFLTVTFFSPTVKQFYKRDFNLISRTLFMESVYRRLPQYNQQVLDDYSSMSARKLADVQALLTKQHDRLAKLCKDNGVSLTASYLHPDVRVVPVIAGHAKTYIQTLKKLDEVYQLAATALLNGVIDGGVRREFELVCRKAVRTFAVMLRYEIKKLWKESSRMRTQMSLPDAELDKAEASHTQAVADFDKAVESDMVTDPNAHVAPEQAAQVIADLAAQTTAAKAGSKSRGKSDSAGTTGNVATPTADASVTS